MFLAKLGIITRAFSTIFPKASTSRDALLIVIGDAIRFTSTIGTSMVLARILPVESMATYRQVIYLGGLAQSIVEFGLSSSIYRFWNLLDSYGRSTYVKMQLILSMGLGAVASITLAILAPLLAVWFHNPELSIALLICCASPLVNIVPLTIRPVFICKGKPLTATFIQTTFSLAMVFGIVIPFLWGAGLNQALMTWMAVNFIEVFLTFIILKPAIIPDTPIWDKELFITTWDYLWPMQAGRVPGILTSYTDKIATSLFLSTEAFAAYSLGAKELPFIGMIGYSLSNVLVPKLVINVEEGRIDNVCRVWKRTIERTSLFTYPIIGYCIWFSEPLVQFLYSAKYSASSIPFAIYSAITFVRVIEYASLAKAFGKTKLIMNSAICAALIMIIFSFPLTAWFGIWGMSVTLLLAVYMSMGYYLFAYCKLLKTNLSNFYPWKRLIFIALASIACAAIVDFLFSPILQLSSSEGMLILGIKLIALLIMSVILYVLFMIIFGIIPLQSIVNLFSMAIKEKGVQHE